MASDHSLIPTSASCGRRTRAIRDRVVALHRVDLALHRGPSGGWCLGRWLRRCCRDGRATTVGAEPQVDGRGAATAAPARGERHNKTTGGEPASGHDNDGSEHTRSPCCRGQLDLRGKIVVPLLPPRQHNFVPGTNGSTPGCRRSTATARSRRRHGEAPVWLVSALVISWVGRRGRRRTARPRRRQAGQHRGAGLVRGGVSCGTMISRPGISTVCGQSRRSPSARLVIVMPYWC